MPYSHLVLAKSSQFFFSNDHSTRLPHPLSPGDFGSHSGRGGRLAVLSLAAIDPVRTGVRRPEVRARQAAVVLCGILLHQLRNVELILLLRQWVLILELTWCIFIPKRPLQGGAVGLAAGLG